MHRVISADSHVFEPKGLWEQRLDKNLRDRGPRLVDAEHGMRQIMVEVDGKMERLQHIANNTVDSGEVEGQSGDPYGYDPLKRLAVVQEQGVDAEILFPTLGLYNFTMSDAGLQLACARVYNDWMAEVFSAHRRHFAWGATIPLLDIDGAVAEIERTARLGAGFLMLPLTAPKGRPFFDTAYEPVWAAAAAHGLTLTMHAHTGITDEECREYDIDQHPAQVLTLLMRVAFPAPITMAHMMGSGVFDRYPDLHLVTIETGASWMAWMLEEWEKLYGPVLSHSLDMKYEPRHYLGSNLHAAFMNDKLAVRLRDVTGPEAIVWGSDYPHREGTYPHTRKVIEEVFAGCSSGDQVTITGGTAARLFGFDA